MVRSHAKHGDEVVPDEFGEYSLLSVRNPFQNCILRSTIRITGRKKRAEMLELGLTVIVF